MPRIHALKNLLLTAALYAFLSMPGMVVAQGPPLQVAVSICPPFVMYEDGKLSGLSMLLWSRIAEALEVDFTVDEMEFADMLEAVSSGQADAGVSCLSITREREETMDFSHSYFETHTAIAVREHGFLEMVRDVITSPKVMRGIAIVFGAAILVGTIFFLLEHRINNKLYAMRSRGGKIMEALVIGLLFVTRGPIRYYEFHTPTARILAAVLASVSTLFIAAITAVLASALTLEHLGSRINDTRDLANARVGAMRSSTSSAFLAREGIVHQRFEDLGELVDELDAGRLDAVVSDAAFLKYEIRKGNAQGKYRTLTVLPKEYDKQNYGIALIEGSPYVEQTNLSLLEFRKSPLWGRAMTSFLGN